MYWFSENRARTEGVAILKTLRGHFTFLARSGKNSPREFHVTLENLVLYDYVTTSGRSQEHLYHPEEI